MDFSELSIATPPQVDTLTAKGGLYLAQKDGAPPKTLVAGNAPGESGVSVHSVRFQGGAQLSARLREHLICFHLSQARLECSVDGEMFGGEAPIGALTIRPAGSDYTVIAKESMDTLFIKIDSRKLALAAAEYVSPEARLIERTLSFDAALFDTARMLALESANDYPRGALVWNEIATGLIEALAARHTAVLEGPAGGRLSGETLRRIREYITARLSGSIEVTTLARLAGSSPSHFTRLFSRTMGLTPHRYVIHLRLQHAVSLMRDGGFSLVDIAALTGFADQSHLSRWMRRVYGVSPSQILCRTRAKIT